MGYWMAGMPELHLVHLRRFASWANSFHQISDARQLLVVHRTPWEMFAWLQRHAARLWRAAEGARVHSDCADAPPCRHCAHDQSQRVCSLHIRLPRRHSPSLQCVSCRCTARSESNATSTAVPTGGCKWIDDVRRADPTIASCREA